MSHGNVNLPYKIYKGLHVYDDKCKKYIVGNTEYLKCDGSTLSVNDYPELAKFMDNSFDLPASKLYEEGYSEATRKSGGVNLELFQKACPNLLGGSADLTKSTQAKGINGNNTILLFLNLLISTSSGLSEIIDTCSLFKN